MISHARGGSAEKSILLVAMGSTSLRRVIGVRIAPGEWADQLVEAQFVLRSRREGVANPIQTPCQKQHGPLHPLIHPIIAWAHGTGRGRNRGQLNDTAQYGFMRAPDLDQIAGRRVSY
jgi:hypothetical protein